MGLDEPQRTNLPIPIGPRRADDVRRQGPGYGLPADQRRSVHPMARPNVLIILIDDAGFGFEQRLRWSGQHPELRAAGCRRDQLHPLPHDRPVLPDAGRAAERAQPPHRRDGWHHRDRHLRARLQLGPTEHVRAAGGDAQAQRLLDRAVRQVPRGAGLADQPDGSVRRLAERRRWLRALLRLHRRRDEPVRPGPLQRHDARRARPDAGGGLSPDGGPDRPRDRLGPPAEGPDARQAVLHVLRARRDARPASRRPGWSAKYKGEFDQGWDELREETLRSARRRAASSRRTPS